MSPCKVCGKVADGGPDTWILCGHCKVKDHLSCNNAQASDKDKYAVWSCCQCAMQGKEPVFQRSKRVPSTPDSCQAPAPASATAHALGYDQTDQSVFQMTQMGFSPKMSQLALIEANRVVEDAVELLLMGTKTSACEQCKKRKTKCSKDLPSCSLCLKKGLGCSYPTRGIVFEKDINREELVSTPKKQTRSQTRIQHSIKDCAVHREDDDKQGNGTKEKTSGDQASKNDTSGKLFTTRMKSSPNKHANILKMPVCFECKKRRTKCTRDLPSCSACEEKDLSCSYPNDETTLCLDDANIPSGVKMQEALASPGNKVNPDNIAQAGRANPKSLKYDDDDIASKPYVEQSKVINKNHSKHNGKPCLECKRRKKKCSKEHPSCKSCTKRNTSCLYPVQSSLNPPSISCNKTQKQEDEPKSGNKVIQDKTAQAGSANPKSFKYTDDNIAPKPKVDQSKVIKTNYSKPGNKVNPDKTAQTGSTTPKSLKYVDDNVAPKPKVEQSKVIKTNRSKYSGKVCFECKRRKVRCSKEQPSCKSCTKRNVSCVYPVQSSSNTSAISCFETQKQKDPLKSGTPIRLECKRRKIKCSEEHPRYKFCTNKRVSHSNPGESSTKIFARSGLKSRKLQLSSVPKSGSEQVPFLIRKKKQRAKLKVRQFCCNLSLTSKILHSLRQSGKGRISEKSGHLLDDSSEVSSAVILSQQNPDKSTRSNVQKSSKRKVLLSRDPACLECRKRKKRCPRDRPFCTSCMMRNVSCVYPDGNNPNTENAKPPKRTRTESKDSNALSSEINKSPKNEGLREIIEDLWCEVQKGVSKENQESLEDFLNRQSEEKQGLKDEKHQSALEPVTDSLETDYKSPENEDLLETGEDDFINDPTNDDMIQSKITIPLTATQLDGMEQYDLWCEAQKGVRKEDQESLEDFLNRQFEEKLKRSKDEKHTSDLEQIPVLLESHPDSITLKSSQESQPKRISQGFSQGMKTQANQVKFEETDQIEVADSITPSSESKCSKCEQRRKKRRGSAEFLKCRRCQRLEKDKVPCTPDDSKGLRSPRMADSKYVSDSLTSEIIPSPKPKPTLSPAQEVYHKTLELEQLKKYNQKRAAQIEALAHALEEFKEKRNEDSMKKKCKIERKTRSK